MAGRDLSRYRIMASYVLMSFRGNHHVPVSFYHFECQMNVKNDQCHHSNIFSQAEKVHVTVLFHSNDCNTLFNSGIKGHTHLVDDLC